jgi:hypothetical protein
VPTVDYWTFFGQGIPWRAYSWLPEIIFAWVEGLWSLSGLMVLSFMLAGTLALVLSYTFSRLAGHYPLGLILGVYCTVATFNHFTLRPQAAIWALFALTLLVSDAAMRAKAPNRVHYGLLIAIMVVWANTHISSILGLSAIAAWSFSRVGWIHSIRLMGAGFIGTLITPYLGGEWAMFFETASHPFAFRSIAEFAPASIYQYSTVFMVLLVIYVAAAFHLKPTSMRALHLIYAGGLTLGSLAVIKMLPFAVITLAAAFASGWRVARQQDSSTVPFAGLGEGIIRLSALIEKLPREGFAFVLLAMLIVRTHNTFQTQINADIVPVDAASFIIQEELPPPYLNTFGQGGYLMYRLSNERGEPSSLVSLDGRTNIIPPKIWESFLKTLNGGIGWKDYIQRVQPKTILWKWESPLTTLLLEGSSWCMVMSRGSPSLGTVVFLERSEFNMRRDRLKSANCV